MSRIGKLPIALPAGVKISIDDANLVTVKGPRGELNQKIDKDLEIETDWPYYFGYADGNSLVLTQDKAGSIIPVTTGSGNQISVTGYVFTGKFGLGTNEMMGLVRMNLNGTLVP